MSRVSCVRVGRGEGFFPDVESPLHREAPGVWRCTSRSEDGATVPESVHKGVGNEWRVFRRGPDPVFATPDSGVGVGVLSFLSVCGGSVYVCGRSTTRTGVPERCPVVGTTLDVTGARRSPHLVVVWRIATSLPKDFCVHALKRVLKRTWKEEDKYYKIGWEVLAGISIRFCTTNLHDTVEPVLELCLLSVIRLFF